MIILHGAILDSADVIENEILCLNIQFTFASSVHWRLLFKRYLEIIVLNKSKHARNTDGNFFFILRKVEKRHFDMLF